MLWNRQRTDWTCSSFDRASLRDTDERWSGYGTSFEPRAFELRPPLEAPVSLMATSYQASFI